MTSDPPLSAASHVSVFGGHPDAVQIGLRECRTDRSSGLSGTSSSVSTECGGTAHLPHEIRRPHHRRACQSTLHSARPRADWVQSCLSDTKFFTEVRRGTWVHSFLLPICPVVGHCAWSAGTNSLLVPHARLSTVGNRAFTVAGPRVWNTLPEDITTSESLPMFCHQLKTWLFRKSYPNVIIWTCLLSV